MVPGGGLGGGEVGVPQKIMRAHCAEIRPDHFKFASYGSGHNAHLYVNHCFTSSKHDAFKSAAPKGQFCGSASYTKADSEGKVA